MGFTLGEHLAPEDMQARYLTLEDGTSVGKPPPLMCLARAMVVDRA
jgi:hypothetical protein